MIAAIVDFVRTKGAMPATPARKIGNEQIVVLCRDASVRDLVTSWLAQNGQTVRVARDGWDAHWVLSANSTNSQALIIDQILPRWPGIESIFVLKKKMPFLKVVLIQDCSDDTIGMAGMVGADTSIETPLNRNYLLDALDLGA